LNAVQIVRLHDPSRRPAGWMDIIRPGQFAVFASDADSGGPRDLEGARLATADAVCAIVDTLEEARAVCDAAVALHPALRLDVFDAEGRARPPLLTVAHPQRAAALEHAPRQMRTRRIIGWSLIAFGVPQVVYAYLESANRDRDIVLPAFIGINMILFGGRLLWLNLALRETERAREARIAAVTAGSPPASPDSADPTRPSRRQEPR
jgi:hypothetical protein